MAGSMVYRLRVSNSDDSHMKLFRQAMANIQRISDNRGYHHIAGFHGRPGQYCWHTQFVRGQGIPPRLFLPWHRAYLWYLEQAMQDQVGGIAIPWWDWTRDQEIPDAYSHAQIDGTPNPLYNFHMQFPSPDPVDRVTQRNSGNRNRLITLPTKRDVQNLLNLKEWGDFSDALERHHNSVHVWVGGDMANTGYAAFDPLFYAHHSMIDRIWYLWQVKHGHNNFPNQFLDYPLAPFNKTCRDVLDVEALGYEYAATVDSIDI